MIVLQLRGIDFRPTDSSPRPGYRPRDYYSDPVAEAVRTVFVDLAQFLVSRHAPFSEDERLYLKTLGADAAYLNFLTRMSTAARDYFAPREETPCP